ncbi:MAG: hypothetical protein ACYDA0_06535 [Candidatus Dormibacteraceae bacterium]
MAAGLKRFAITLPTSAYFCSAGGKENFDKAPGMYVSHSETGPGSG